MIALVEGPPRRPVAVARTTAVSLRGVAREVTTMAIILFGVLLLALALVPMLVASFCVWMEHEAETPARAER